MGSKERFYVDTMALQPEVTGSCNLVIVNYPNGEKQGLLLTVVCFRRVSIQNIMNVFHLTLKTLSLRDYT